MEGTRILPAPPGRVLVAAGFAISFLPTLAGAAGEPGRAIGEAWLAVGICWGLGLYCLLVACLNGIGAAVERWHDAREAPARARGSWS